MDLPAGVEIEDAEPEEDGEGRLTPWQQEHWARLQQYADTLRQEAA